MKRSVHTIFLAALSALAASCITDPMREEPGTENDRATVTFHLRSPSLARGAASTRDVPEGIEDDITDITVFMAHDNGSGYVMDSMIVVDQFRAVSATTQAFTISLRESSVPTKVFVVANLRDPDNGLRDKYAGEFTALNGKGMYEAEFIRLFVDKWAIAATDAPGTGGMCMYMAGTAELPTIEGKEVNMHIPLLRWVARADVNIDLGVESLPFVPTGVSVWHGYENACVFAGSAAYDPNNAARVIHPTLADAARLPGDHYIPVTMTGNTTGLAATAYIGEQDGRTAYADKLDATCLILGGYFNGSTTESFYRIDFNSELAGHPFGQVLRNWQYIFNVTKIMSRGYDTPEEAAANPAHSIVVEVEMWDENVQQINFVGSGDYMYVNTLEVTTNYNQSAQGTFVVRSTMDFEWGFDTVNTLPSTSDAALTDSLPGVSPKSNFSVRITGRDDNMTYTDYTFSVVNTADNETNARNEAGIFISARNATMSVKLSQRNETVSQRVINVLSLNGNYGSMGIWYKNGDNSGGNAMRNILTDGRWFGPTGVVKCGGFSFDQFTTSAFISSYTPSLDKLRRQLDSTDILILCYYNNPNQSVVDVILEWAAKPYHVMFVACDTGGTGTSYSTTVETTTLLRYNLYNNPSFASGLTWYYTSDLAPIVASNNQSANKALTAAFGSDYLMKLYTAGNGAALQSGEPINACSNSMVMADQTPENAAFMAGPFGLPEQGMLSTTSSYLLWDGYSEFAVPSGKSTVMPLLVLKANVFGYNPSLPVITKTNAMMVGVDVPHTIVYMGEIQQMEAFLTVAPPAGYTAGMSGSPYYNSLTTLMSNIWAWGVKNVLAQVKND